MIIIIINQSNFTHITNLTQFWLNDLVAAVTSSSESNILNLSLFLTQSYHMSSEDLEYKAHYDTDKLPTIFVLLCKDDANLPAH